MFQIAFLGDRHLDDQSPRFGHAVDLWRAALEDAFDHSALAAVAGLGDVFEGWPGPAALAAASALYARSASSVSQSHAPRLLTAEVLGNHEDPLALEWLKTWGVCVASDQIVTWPLRRGPAGALLLFLPYARRGRAPYLIGEQKSIQASMAAAVDVVRHEVEMALEEATRERLPLIVAGHLTVGGMRTGASDFEIHTAQEMVVPPEVFAGAALVVVGHIHKAQVVAPNIVGAGSLYRCSAAEADEDKSYLLVTVSETEGVSWERRPLAARAIVRLEVAWSDIASGKTTVDDLLAQVPEGAECTVDVHADESQRLSLDERAFDALKARSASFKINRSITGASRPKREWKPTSPDMIGEVEAWAQSTGYAIPAEQSARLVGKIERTTPGTG